MAKFRVLCAWLLALPLIVFGGNYFVELFELPPGDGSAGDQLLQSMRDGGLMVAIAASHVAVGLMLLVPNLRFAGGMLQLPISLGILAFHVTMLPAGVGLAVGLLVLNIVVLIDERRLRAMIASTDRPW